MAVQTMMEINRPISQDFREAGYRWADLEKAAKLLEETKSALLAKKCAELGDMAVNKAEQIVKASDDWHDHLKVINDARWAANVAWIDVEAEKMRYGEWNNDEANHRLEAKL